MLAATALLAAAGCSGSKSNASEPTPSASRTPDAPPATIAVAAPANKATKVLTSTDLSFTTNGKLTDVKLTGPGGKVVAGTVGEDGKTWTPGTQLAYESAYTVTATATSGSSTKTVTSTFTTMDQPYSITGADLYVDDGEKVGVALPVVVEFTNSIPESQRAAVERRLFVHSTPAVEGSWHWFSSSEVHFRPKEYWPTGTKVDVRLAIGGLPMGNGNYGKRDRVVHFTVGRSLVAKVYNKDKTMYVYQDGKLIKKFPISLGKPSTPTSSGNLVAMEKAYVKTFDSGTFGVPADSPGGYREDVYYDVRYTWGGEFVHAAPWSTGEQGSVNVSHGCVNAATENAKWYYNIALRGDPILISGTEARVKPGDGWTDWELTWADYVAGSALK